MEQGLEKVLNLLASRAVGGEATNDDVEAAIDELLQTTRSNADEGGNATAGSNPPVAEDKASKNAVDEKTEALTRATASIAPIGTATTRQVESRSAVSKERLIDVDTEEYDDVKDGGSFKPPAPTSVRKRGRPRKHPVTNPVTAPPQIQNHLYELIPLGIQGAKMLVAFGDGPQPLPVVVSKTLQATRAMLHAAIRDARYVRKRNQLFYRQAQQYVRGQPAPPPQQQHEQQGERLRKKKKMRHDPAQQHAFHFRAMQRGDALGFSPPCGFDMEDLRLLFPEEVNAYQKWNDMHNSTKKSSEEEATNPTIGVGSADDDDHNNDDNNNMNNDIINNDKDTVQSMSTGGDAGKDNDDDVVIVAGGHLHERMEQFDIRTFRMEREDYLRFSNVRFQGSFLPRRAVREDQHREEELSSNPRGRAVVGSTARMATVTLRFLHWIGFDITGTTSGGGRSESSTKLRLAAPSSETIQVLAFLAHDFFGRIVEKAIFWRNVGMDETKVVLELNEGEQLQESDIDRALNDPEIRLTALYATNVDKDNQRNRPKPQLYFGPGFEDRLEMELDEFVEPALSEEEIKQREEEDALFANLAAPPSIMDDDIFSRGSRSQTDGGVEEEDVDYNEGEVIDDED